MKKILTIFITFIFITALSFPQEKTQKGNIQKLISQMTLEEKAKLVVGMGVNFPGAPPSNEPAIGQILDKVPGAAGSTYEIPRLEIPSIVLADGPAGLRIAPQRNDSTDYYATAFPIATLLASTWDTSIVRQVGSAIGNEVLEYGVDIILMPALNLQRNPLCGRNFEYYSEDPFLTGTIAASMVNGIQSNGVGTSLKHFVANNQETNRNNINEIISERALREIYLKGFEIAVTNSNPWTVMSSYNIVNGTYTSENHDLLTSILRDEWKFKGFVMTDWFGGKDAVAQMKAGNDLLMPGYKQQTESIISAVNKDELDKKILDKNLENFLGIVFQTPVYKKYNYSNNPDLEKHAQICRDAATEGMILLKNSDETLPLKVNGKIALFGNSSYSLITGGTGSGDVNEAYNIPLEQGLLNAGYKLDEKTIKLYTSYLKEEESKQPKQFNPFFPKPPIPQMPVQNIPFDELADNTNVAIITIGRSSGEFTDRKLTDDFLLSSVEQDLIEKVSYTFHEKNKKVIVILNIGGVIETASWKDKVDAILIAWQPGQEGGNSITDVINGKKNPSGKLAITFPIKYEDVPSSKNFHGGDSVVYAEDIYVGYRYFDTFNVEPSFEFGFGLSYAKFKYENFKLSSDIFEGSLTVSVEVKNVGTTPGKEVIQLYISSPTKNLDKPKQELKAFQKTVLLQSSESQTITFKILPKDLASYNTKRSAWIAEIGNYTINIGASSRDIKSSLKFNLPTELVVEKTRNLLTPKSEIRRLFINN
jgi:beta-glucosidase